jgi:hypothetical protein
MKMWICREKGGDLSIHERPNPSYLDVTDSWYGDLRGYIGRENFPEVTFENSPMEVELKLIEK